MQRPDNPEGGNPSRSAISGRGVTGQMSLNVHLAVPQTPVASGSSSAGQECGGGAGGHTPNTPEILNSIVNMQSGPFAAYASSAATQQQHQQHQTQSSVMQNLSSPADSSSLDSTTSPCNESPSAALSVQHYRSQFIKEGLKMKVRQKLGQSSSSDLSPLEPPQLPPQQPQACCSVRSNSSSSSPAPSDSMLGSIKQEELTEEDEMRRMRRRERNKIAATKCRNKKKHRTQLLMKESDILEAQHRTLKSEISKLQLERNRLAELLSLHEPTCSKRLRRQQQQQQEMDSSFRVPAVPAAPQQTQDLSAVQQQQQQSFDFLESEVKPQLQLNDFPMEDLEEDIGRGSFLRNSCSFDLDPSATGFLAKRPLQRGYLDMDSRCITL